MATKRGPKVGRPTAAPTEKYDQRVTVLLTANQVAQIAGLCRAELGPTARSNVAGWVRSAALARLDRVRKHQEAK